MMEKETATKTKTTKKGGLGCGERQGQQYKSSAG